MRDKGWGWFAAALIVIIIGYVSLGSGSTALAPLMLVLGYCILVPAALLRAFSKTSIDEGE